MSSVSDIQAALDAFGLEVRGCLNFEANEKAPSLFNDSAARSVMLIGHGGAAPWTHFKRWQDALSSAIENPLDAWSKNVISPIADTFRGQAVFPSERPFFPFQQWAMRAEDLRPSPLGLLIHPVYGLWHAYRGAILFPVELEIQALQILSHPCETCVEKPCLTACPVKAFSNDGYDVKSCRQHLADKAAQPCMQGGCLARRACPVGLDYQYGSEQMQFHMRAFAK
jgi:hypothetical protein